MLSDLRVLELTDERGHLAGKILGDLGADVVKVEAPGGDPSRDRGPHLGDQGHDSSLGWLAHNTSKRSVAIALDSPAGREALLSLVQGCDVVIESSAPGRLDSLGLGREVLCERRPGLIVCSITPFGQTGPYSQYRAGDLVVVAMGGNAILTGDPDRPPVRCSLPTSRHHAAPMAVLGVLAALHARELGRSVARGQLVDVSMQECQLATLMTGPGQYALTGTLSSRQGARLGKTLEIWRARDGFVTFGLRGGPTRIPNLIAMVEFMKEGGRAPAWLLEFDWKSYSPITASDEQLAALEGAFGSFFSSMTMSELYEAALERRILLAPCNDASEILRQPQLRDRGLFIALDYDELGATIEHPRFFAKSSAFEIGIRSRAPRVGEHDDALLGKAGDWSRPVAESVPSIGEANDADNADGIFAGLNILELGAGAAGPVATGYFAEHGATVVRIESAVRPDFLRMLHMTRDNQGEPDILDRAPMFALMNPNKQSLALNLKMPEAVALVKRLARWADVVSENFAPGVMDRFGLDYESLRAEREDLIMVSGCLFGQTGPQRSYPGFGGQGSAIAGYNHLTGHADSAAHGPYGTITDSLAPRYVAVTIAAALHARRRTGKGQYIDVSQIECGVYSLSELIVRNSASGESLARCGNREAGVAPHGIYPCRDEERGKGAEAERWIAIAARTEEEWSALTEALDLANLKRDPRFVDLDARLRHQEELDREIAKATCDWIASELMKRLQAVGVEAGVVQDHQDLLNDSQLAHRAHFVSLRHNVLGDLETERSGFRIEGAPAGRLANSAPLLGEHNQSILEGTLGLSPEEVRELVTSGVVA